MKFNVEILEEGLESLDYISVDAHRGEEAVEQLGEQSMSDSDLEVPITLKVSGNFREFQLENFLTGLNPMNVEDLYCCIYVSDSKNNKVEVGQFEASFIKGQIENDILGYMDQADCDSSWKSYDALYSIEYGETTPESFLTIIHRIELKKEYQNKGIGTEIIKKFIQFVNDHQVDYLVLQPDPLIPYAERQGPNGKILKKEAREKLIRYYERFGFQKIKTKIEMANPYYSLKMER
ncbi:GNAT family N-acetyltransferase [[Brevibacterium] frigoritolerans]|nr:GNAT family N-acetyltransferase [Peribacillus frigoritolerans]